MSIKYKLILAMLSIGLGVLALVASLFFYASRKAIIERSMEQLTSIRTLKAHDLEDYVRQRLLYLQLLRSSRELNEAFHQAKPDMARETIIPIPVVEVSEPRSNDMPAVWYVPYHAGPTFQLQGERDWQMTDSLNKRLVNYLNTFSDTDSVRLEEDWAPNEKEPLLFLTLPVRHETASGVRRGQLIAALGMTEVNAILHRHSGLGKTGESYVVGSDYHLRLSLIHI